MTGRKSAETIGEGFAFFHWHVSAKRLSGCYHFGHWGCIQYWRSCQLNGVKPL
jgi:hypothetical protein